MIKTDLTTHANLGREAFPWPGVLQARSPEDEAAILAGPGAFFGDPVTKERLALDSDGNAIGGYVDAPHDPCPEGARGFGWWPDGAKRQRAVRWTVHRQAADPLPRLSGKIGR